MKNSKGLALALITQSVLAEQEMKAVSTFKQNLTTHITRKERETKAKRKKLKKLSARSKKRNR